MVSCKAWGLLFRPEGGMEPSSTSLAGPSTWLCTEKDPRSWNKPSGKVTLTDPMPRP